MSSKHQTISGLHGTSLENANRILNTTFKKSKGKEQWLGDGVYFFIEGISKAPEEDAMSWAIAEAWNDSTKEYDYVECAVLSVGIFVADSQVLDLTNIVGLAIFQDFRDKIIRLLKENNKKLINYRDSLVIKLMQQELDIRVVKGHFYIKFAEGRKARIRSRIPNITMMSVYYKDDKEYDRLFQQESLKIVKTSTIEL